MTDFHKQVEALLQTDFFASVALGNEKLVDGFRTDIDTGLHPLTDKGNEFVDTFTALVQTLVPEEKDALQDDINTAEENWRLGFNTCRDIILSTIKGVK